MLKSFFATIWNFVLGNSAEQPKTATETEGIIPPFQTEQYGVKYERKIRELEEVSGDLGGKLAELENKKGELILQITFTIAAGELKARRIGEIETQIKVIKGQLELVRHAPSAIRAQLLEEEKQYLLDLNLQAPVIFTSPKWEEVYRWSRDGQVPVDCWLAQRRVVRWDEDVYVLMEVRKRPQDMSRQTGRELKECAFFDPEFVAWVTTSVAQMSKQELEAIVCDQM